MQGLAHPLSGALYERDDTDQTLVRVTQGDQWGLFTSRGVWVAGEIYVADPQFCGWIAGPKLIHHRLQA